VVYEYANRLVDRGHPVTIIHPAVLYTDTPLRDLPKKIVRYLQRRLDGSYRPDKWFKLDSRVLLKWTPTLSQRYVPASDVVIATAWQTAEWLVEYSPAMGKKVCLVYDFEHYKSAIPDMRERIARAFAGPMKTIATSSAVSEMLKECGAHDMTYIPTGIDFEVFQVETSLVDPRRNSIGFPARREGFKGTEDAIRALSIVRRYFRGDLRFWCFGGSKPHNLPDWIEYHKRPSDADLRKLYNESLIFVVPSLYEGWGLPGAEAMACGAALASTDNGGVRTYASHGRNALLSLPTDYNELAQNILHLLEDPALRTGLAKKGSNDIRQFTVQRAVDALEELIADSCSGKSGSLATQSKCYTGED
jgi:glycosyltransferase involved in cell wall biosynthesis